MNPGVQVGLNLQCRVVLGFILRNNCKMGELSLSWDSCFSLFTVVRFDHVATSTHRKLFMDVNEQIHDLALCVSLCKDTLLNIYC